MEQEGRKILMLGGSRTQIAAIEQAKSAGYHVITCDYLPDNPGHQLADEYYNVSTTDIEAVVALAQRLEVEGVVAYASDPAALTAAHVSEALDLPGASVESVRTLSRKDLFRKFQAEHGFPTVRYTVVHCSDEASTIQDWEYPLVVKPVDSSGSKGVTVVESFDDMPDAIEQALRYTRCGKVIIESFVATSHHPIHGDGFVYQGELVFTGLCDSYYIGLVPVADIFPTTLLQTEAKAVTEEVARLLKAVGFSDGAVNIEARISSEGKVIIMEIGARSGGCYFPELMKLGTGFDEVKAIVDLAMGVPVDLSRYEQDIASILYVLCSKEAGCFEDIHLDPEIQKLIVQLYLHLEPGEFLESFGDASKIAGTVIATCSDQFNHQALCDHFANCITVREVCPNE